MNRYFCYITMILCLSLTACESMDETYARFPKDGKIRYVGKCTKLTATPGWERVQLKWVNSLDPTIDKIKIVWSDFEHDQESVLIDKELTSYNVTGLTEDNAYSFEIYSVDKDGKTSIPEVTTARPYTSTHEAVLGFTRVVSKNFELNGTVILFFDRWDDNITEAKLSYYKRGESVPTPAVLTKGQVGLGTMEIPGVDLDKNVTILRRGKLADCDDEIDFLPIVLSFDDFVILSDFAKQLRNRYQLENITKEWVESVEELELDYDLKSLEDIMYFPNLKKISLGKNRFQQALYMERIVNPVASKLEDKKRSIYAMKKMNEILGTTVNRYNKHYFTQNDVAGLGLFTEHGNPDLARAETLIDYLDTNGWTIKYEMEDVTGYDSHLEYLLDNNPATMWTPQVNSTMIRTHEFIIDMKTERDFDGLKVVQKPYLDGESVTSYINYLPNSIKVQLSVDNIAWKPALFTADNILGKSPGEATFIRAESTRRARYLKFTVTDGVYVRNFNAILADLMVFKDK